MNKCFQGPLDEDDDHHDKDDSIKDQDGKDGTQEGAKKHTNFINKAPGGKKGNTNYQI